MKPDWFQRLWFKFLWNGDVFHHLLDTNLYLMYPKELTVEYGMKENGFI